MMDKIIPILPLYSSRNYEAIWANTLGYDERWALTDNMPYMSYDGLHPGQDSVDEFNFADANWKDLNPLFSDDGSSSTVQSFLLEPIVQSNPDFAPIKTGLVYDWEQIDETHYQFWMMDDIYWNPSYNSTGRTASDDALGDLPVAEPYYMAGLRDGLISTGTSHQVTAVDAVFTYLAWGNALISESTSYHEWMSDVYVDPVDDLSFHVHIDGDPDTPEIEPYADMWANLPTNCLPEFFLNSTDPTVSYTEGGVECVGIYADMINTPQWVTFSTSAFGCGKYSLDYSIKNSVTVLERWDGWYGKGAITGETGLTPFVENINIRVIPDSSAELAEFKAGKLDWTDITIFPAERKIMQADPAFQVRNYVGSSLLFMFYNLRRPFIGGVGNFEYLDEVGKEEYTVGLAVRKAINYAIDRDEMNTVIYDGESWVAHSVVYPSQAFYYYNDIIKYNYDVDAAFEWLEAAGYPVPEPTPFPVAAIVAAIGAAAFLAYYRKRK
jgi:ABC-type transport system substrate-binding protein